jgi:hypothetical protein
MAKTLTQTLHNEINQGLFLLRARSARGIRSSAFVLSRVFAAHKCAVPRSLSTFPEPTARFSNEGCSADSAILWPVDLLSRAEAANLC